MADINRNNASQAEIDIDELAESIARKAIKGYEPVPYTVIKELGTNLTMLESAALVLDVINSDDYASNEIFEQVFDRAIELIDELNEGESGLWWFETGPEPPPDPDDLTDPEPVPEPYYDNDPGEPDPPGPDPDEAWARSCAQR